MNGRPALQVGRVHRQRRTQVRSIVIDIGEFTRSLRRLSNVEFLRAGQMDEDAAMDLLTDISDQFDMALNRARNLLNPDQNERLILTIQGVTAEGTSVNVHVNQRDHWMLDGNALAGRLLAALNSYQTIANNFRLVAAVRPRSIEPVQVAGKTSYRGDFGIFIRSKKSVVAISNQDPDLDFCVYQWLAMGVAQLVRDKKMTFRGMTSTTFDSMTKSGQKLQNRRRWSQEVASFLGHTLGVVSDLDLFLEMSRQLGVNLVLLDFWTHFTPIFPVSPLDIFADQPFIFGIVQSEDQKSFSHVDFVSKVEGLSPQKNSRFCYECLSFYSRKKLCAHSSCQQSKSRSCRFCHCCTHVCATCRSSDCEKGEGDCQVSTCGTCHLPVYGERCYQAHLSNEACSPLYSRKCLECGQNEHASGVKCYQYRCRQCAEVVNFGDDRHKCWLRRERMRQPHERYVVYDFECMIDPNTQDHVPYLATAWLPYPTDFLDTLADKYDEYVSRMEGEESPVFVFWGPEGIKVFFQFLREKCFKKYVFYAHNARAYDHILIKQAMMKEYRLYSVDIKRGQKFLQMHFPDLGITFRDSLSFIPSSLRSMSKDFKIEELAKGHFPHSVMTTVFFEQAAQSQFQCELPPREAFETDFDSESDRKEAEEWLTHFYANNNVWDLKKEAIQYCISDTVLLGKVIIAFREQCMEMTEKMTRPVDFVGDPIALDPFAYVTLPSAIMSFYLSQMLPLASIPVLDRYPSLMDQLEQEWLLYEEFQREDTLLRKPVIGGSTVSAKSDTELFVFLSCYKTGCLRCFPQTGFNTRFKKTFEELRLISEKRVSDLQQGNYQVRIQRECEWREQRKRTEIQSFLQQNDQWIQANLPLDPRDAYKGGKSEVYKLMTPSRIAMVDFVSQYPTSMLGESYDPYIPSEKLDWWLPTGFPTILIRPVTYDLSRKKLGIAKVKILPPRQLYSPFLSFQVPSKVNHGSYEVLYGLCRTCMTDRLPQYCLHEEADRSFIGTWTLSEIRYAESLGYQVQEWLEVWEYPGQSKELFRDFIVPFMKNKICSKASGLVQNGAFTEKGTKVAQYLFEITGECVTPADFSNDPARRTVAKLIQNAFTGKWGQKEEYANSGTFYAHDVDKCMKIINDPNINITYLEVLDQEGTMVSMQYEPYLGSSTTYLRKNDHIVAHITAYGRIMLNELEQKLGNRMLYCDTDSAYHEQMSPLPYTPGFRTGDLELELPDAYGWKALGRKSYSYLKPDGALVCRQKGVTIRNSHRPLFHVDHLFKLLEKMNGIQQQVQFMKGKEWDKLLTERQAEIVVPQRLFSTIVGEDQIPVKRTKIIQKRVRFHCFATKRWFQWPEELQENSRIDSLPYGFIQ